MIDLIFILIIILYFNMVFYDNLKYNKHILNISDYLKYGGTIGNNIAYLILSLAFLFIKNKFNI
jgi:hypothetical protein